MIPRGIPRFVEPPEPPQGAEEVGSGAGSWGVPGGLGETDASGIMSAISVPPPPPVSSNPPKPKPIVIGGQVIAAKLIYRLTPEYPPLARMARIQGTVRLEAIIGTDGAIRDLKVLSGHPLLVRAALEAVQRWRYQPTLLNGGAVEVLTEIDVNFKLEE